MTITQQRQAAKGKAFNSILKIYHPKSKYEGDPYNRDENYQEQRESLVRSIMERYFKELTKIRRTNTK